jgi:hypothetical protein
VRSRFTSGDTTAEASRLGGAFVRELGTGLEGWAWS